MGGIELFLWFWLNHHAVLHLLYSSSCLELVGLSFYLAPKRSQGVEGKWSENLLRFPTPAIIMYITNLTDYSNWRVLPFFYCVLSTLIRYGFCDDNLTAIQFEVALHG